MTFYVTIQLRLPSFKGLSSSCQFPLSHFTPCSCFSCNLWQGSFPSPKVLKLISLGWSNHRKTCILMFIHLPISLKYLIKHFPSLKSPKFLIFRINPSFLLQLGNFLWLGLCFAFFDPFPSLNFWYSTFPYFLTSLHTSQNFLKNLEAPYPLHFGKSLVPLIGMCFTQMMFLSNKRCIWEK